MPVRVTYTYLPDDEGLDLDHETGVTDEEYQRVSNLLMMEGAEDVEMERVEDTPNPVQRPRKPKSLRGSDV